MTGAIEIVVGDVTDMEAHVIARYALAKETADVAARLELRGRLRGPFCEIARTLPADFEFHAVDSDENGVVMAEAVVADPCMWSAELPHVYDVDVEARVGDRVVAEYHGKVGLRRLAPRRPVDFAPGTG
jgi:beta-galactosidase/beta-glucuronidase